MSFLAIWGIGFAAILAILVLLWLYSLRLKNASIIDIFWGPGFAILAVIYTLFAEDGYSLRKSIVTVLVLTWGIRLGWHIYTRNVGHGEDFRYQKWREEAGEAWWWRSFFKVFLLQGILMNLIAVPLLAAQYSDSPDHLTIIDILGLILWAIGFFFEAVGDWQLRQFKANPANKGKVLDRGLWRYTRHPNYFGDACQWWGYYAFALSAGAFWTIFSPLIMTGLLMKVSGVALLEKTLVESKPQYRDYMQNTSAFFPMPPRNSTK